MLFVLAALWFETRGEDNAGFNVIVGLSNEKAHCKVVVDNVVRGQFNSPDANGVDSHTMWLKLKNGHHKVEIERDGKIIHSKDLNVSGKEYLRFDSGSPSEAK